MKRSMHKYGCLISCLLLIGGMASAQRTDDAIAQQFDAFRAQNLQEKLFVHTDKAFYVAGEIVWFKIYATDAQLQQPLDLSKVAYVELLNSEHKPVLQAKIAMNEATGNGSFQLPYSINSGNYVLRSYTNWMKNAGADFFFEKNITIINPLKKPDWPAAETSVYDVQFFPESGNLVGGINSKVAFRIVDAHGKSQEATGIIVNQRNDTVTRFKTLRFGMGNFSFKPYDADQYRAILTTNQGITITRPLPVVSPKGTVMQVKDNGRGQLSIHIESTGGGPVYLLVHTRQLLQKMITQDLANGEAEIKIDKKDLGEGISHFTVFNESKQPVCERLWFTRPSAMLVSLQPDAGQYATRKKVTLTITTKDPLSQPVTGNLSASVYLADALQTAPESGILSYLWLQSDLKGTIESPAYYFSENSPDLAEATDNLMLTQGWRRFKWENVMRATKSPIDFVPEAEGHIIQGKLVDKRNNQPAANITAYLSVPREKPLFNNAISTANGSVKFDVKNFYGGNEIVLQTNVQTDSLYRVDISSPFFEKYSETKTPLLAVSEKDADLLLVHSMQAQIGNTYYADKQRQFLFPRSIDTMAFYGNGDKQYYLDDYTRFITMEEVMREYIADVRVRNNNDKFSYRMRDKAFDRFFETPPLVLIDGIPVFDPTRIIALDPLKIKRIDVVAQKFYQNNLLYDGIIQYHSYQGDLAGYQLDPNALVIEYEGMQLEREFYSPIYETPGQLQSRLPDMRNLLYWSPEIRTDITGNKQVSFYTGDTPGKYIVVIQGITSNGLAGSSSTGFTVVK